MQLVANGLWKTFDLDHHLSGGPAAVDPFDGRGRQRLRRSTRRWSCDESAGAESRQIVVTRRLDVVPEKRDVLDHRLALFVFRRDGFLAAILRVRNQGIEEVETQHGKKEGR